MTLDLRPVRVARLHPVRRCVADAERLEVSQAGGTQPQLADRSALVAEGRAIAK